MREPVGVLIPCVTIFDDEGGLDLPATRSNIRWLVDAGVHGLLISGSCGEFSALEEHERYELTEAAVDEVAGRAITYVGVMHTSTATAIRLAQHAERSGADVVMSVPPYYSSGPEREVTTYFRDIAASVSLPLMVYNNPGASGVALSVQTLGELAVEGTAKLIKESHGDPTRIHDLRLVCPEATRLVYGEDFGAFEALMVGADGWVAGVGNIVPELALDLWGRCRDGDVEAARTLWFEILPLINMTSFKPMFGRPNERPDYIQIFKSGLDLRGRTGGSVRRPLLPLPDPDVAHLKGLLEDLGVLSPVAH